jgi:hypothetical protein
VVVVLLLAPCAAAAAVNERPTLIYATEVIRVSKCLGYVGSGFLI